jgi:chromate transport protein ChrA
MANVIWNVLYIVIAVVVMMLIMSLGRKYVFSKFRVNKWILLVITIVFFVVQIVFKPQNLWISLLLSLITVWFFLWFMDVQSNGRPNARENKIVIRPKAKPNRVKHLKDQKK